MVGGLCPDLKSIGVSAHKGRVGCWLMYGDVRVAIELRYCCCGGDCCFVDGAGAFGGSNCVVRPA